MQKLAASRGAIASVLGFGLGWASACDDATECRPGTEACPCRDGGGCLDGLSCLSEYCVDPDWVAGDPDDGDGDGDDGPPGGKAGDHDNVAACEAWLEGASCGGFDYTDVVDCDVYADTVCDVSDYFDCLDDNTTCTGDFPDTSRWPSCASLAECD